MMNFTLGTLIDCLRCDDSELNKTALAFLQERYGEEILRVIKEALENERAEIIQSLYVTDDDKNFLTQWADIQKLRKKGKMYLTTLSIYDLYHSGNFELVKKSKEQIERAYRRRVWDIIHKHYRSYEKNYKDDLFQVGIIGILEALKRYDPAKSKFNTYSTNFIWHELSDFIDFQSGQSSAYYRSLQKRMKNAVQYLENVNKTVTIERLHDLTGYPKQIIEREWHVMRRVDRAICLDAWDSANDILDETAKNPEDQVQQKQITDKLRMVLSQLESRTRQIVVLNSIDGMSFAKIASELKISKYKVQKYYQEGIRYMRDTLLKDESFMLSLQ